jgi:hypothetical protein
VVNLIDKNINKLTLATLHSHQYLNLIIKYDKIGSGSAVGGLQEAKAQELDAKRVKL